MSGFCKNCGVKVTDHTTFCPLCQNVLDHSSVEGEATYPNITERFKKLVLIKRIALFLGILICVFTLFVDFKLSRRPDWSVLVVVAAVYLLAIFFTFSDPESGYRKRICLILFGGTLIILMIDLQTGNHGWSVNFFLPGLIFFMNIGLFILMIINRRNWQSYMLYQIGVIFIGVVPLILIALRVVTYPLISELAFLSSVLVFVGTVIFGGRVARIELRRRFHI